MLNYIHIARIIPLSCVLAGAGTVELGADARNGLEAALAFEVESPSNDLTEHMQGAAVQLDGYEVIEQDQEIEQTKEQEL